MHLSASGKVARQELFWRDGWHLALAAAGLSAQQDFA
jgi:hypothetical protein